MRTVMVSILQNAVQILEDLLHCPQQFFCPSVISWVQPDKTFTKMDIKDTPISIARQTKATVMEKASWKLLDKRWFRRGS